MARLPDYTGNPDYDSAMQDWIERHLHGYHPEDTGVAANKGHKGGMVFPVDSSKSDFNGQVVTDDGRLVGEMSPGEMEAVQSARAELRKIGVEMNDYRDELRESGVECHLRHGQPSLPGKPCMDYHADSKRLGRRNTPRESRLYLCTFCPYESSVTVQKRSNRGDYKEHAGQRRRRR